MFIGYCFINHKDKKTQELAIIPNKITPEFQPIPLFDLKTTKSGLLFVSADESVKISSESGGGFLISPYDPARLYLSPNVPERPGFSVQSIKVSQQGQDLSISYDRGKGWEEFTPDKTSF